MTRANPLPDDVETLKAMLLSQEAALRERDAQVLKLQETVDSQQAALAARAAEIEHLKLLIAKLRRMQFGRKSEKLDRQIEQLELRLEELETDEGAAPVEIPKTPRAAVEQAPRKPLPETSAARAPNTPARICREVLRVRWRDEAAGRRYCRTT
ncbi:TolA-binding protein [Paraburkholderia sp. JPY158]|uniref:TolA-binding protein n=1 Tax=Paraburkholderia atlantica TaxID=2654982 RepID=A0A7W8QFX1_PARAM|nr:TolA-binding protein [Paraburkholderia atlantica]